MIKTSTEIAQQMNTAMKAAGTDHDPGITKLLIDLARHLGDKVKAEPDPEKAVEIYWNDITAVYRELTTVLIAPVTGGEKDANEAEVYAGFAANAAGIVIDTISILARGIGNTRVNPDEVMRATMGVVLQRAIERKFGKVF